MSSQELHSKIVQINMLIKIINKNELMAYFNF